MLQARYCAWASLATPLEACATRHCCEAKVAVDMVLIEPVSALFP
jgi:hypothetical protein